MSVPEQLAFTLFLLWYGADIFYDCSNGNYGTDTNNCMKLLPTGVGKVASSNYRDTIIYNAFVLAQLANEVCSRKIYNELNMFSGLLSNRMFLAILFISLSVQVVTVQFAQVVFKTVPLDLVGWFTCVVIALVSFPLSVLQRLLPPWSSLADFVGRYSNSPEEMRAARIAKSLLAAARHATPAPRRLSDQAGGRFMRSSSWNKRAPHMLVQEDPDPDLPAAALAHLAGPAPPSGDELLAAGTGRSDSVIPGLQDLDDAELANDPEAMVAVAGPPGPLSTGRRPKPRWAEEDIQLAAE